MILLLLICLLAGVFTVIKHGIVLSVKGIALLLRVTFALIGAALVLAGGVIGAVIGLVLLICLGIRLLIPA